MILEEIIRKEIELSEDYPFPDKVPEINRSHEKNLQKFPELNLSQMTDNSNFGNQSPIISLQMDSQPPSPLVPSYMNHQHYPNLLATETSDNRITFSDNLMMNRASMPVQQSDEFQYQNFRQNFNDMISSNRQDTQLNPNNLSNTGNINYQYQSKYY